MKRDLEGRKSVREKRKDDYFIQNVYTMRMIVRVCTVRERVITTGWLSPLDTTLKDGKRDGLQ